jgi:hypothetical protein
MSGPRWDCAHGVMAETGPASAAHVDRCPLRAMIEDGEEIPRELARAVVELKRKHRRASEERFARVARSMAARKRSRDPLLIALGLTL